uniref:Uncharacterized protein n=1 Tax=Micrurus spixii TaxID=129469 RepID=A0A2D4MT08_9SAUR
MKGILHPGEKTACAPVLYVVRKRKAQTVQAPPHQANSSGFLPLIVWTHKRLYTGFGFNVSSIKSGIKSPLMSMEKRSTFFKGQQAACVAVTAGIAAWYVM